MATHLVERDVLSSRAEHLDVGGSGRNVDDRVLLVFRLGGGTDMQRTRRTLLRGGNSLISLPQKHSLHSQLSRGPQTFFVQLFCSVQFFQT